jgi:hypothetical protein
LMPRRSSSEAPATAGLNLTLLSSPSSSSRSRSASAVGAIDDAMNGVLHSTSQGVDASVAVSLFDEHVRCCVRNAAAGTERTLTRWVTEAIRAIDHPQVLTPLGGGGWSWVHGTLAVRRSWTPAMKFGQARMSGAGQSRPWVSASRAMLISTVLRASSSSL